MPKVTFRFSLGKTLEITGVECIGEAIQQFLKTTGRHNFLNSRDDPSEPSRHASFSIDGDLIGVAIPLSRKIMQDTVINAKSFSHTYASVLPAFRAWWAEQSAKMCCAYNNAVQSQLSLLILKKAASQGTLGVCDLPDEMWGCIRTLLSPKVFFNDVKRSDISTLLAKDYDYMTLKEIIKRQRRINRYQIWAKQPSSFASSHRVKRQIVKLDNAMRQEKILPRLTHSLV